jgi:hypothetical protein
MSRSARGTGQPGVLGSQVRRATRLAGKSKDLVSQVIRSARVARRPSDQVSQEVSQPTSKQVSKLARQPSELACQLS